MRQLTAIILLGVQLFGFAGLPGLLRMQVNRHRIQVETRVDEGAFDRSMLIERKVPLHQPYYSSSLHYERYYGEARIDGVWHTYVMRKVFNDTVYLLCLPDHGRGLLERTVAGLTVQVQGLAAQDMNDGQQEAVASPKKMLFPDSWYEEQISEKINPVLVFLQGADPRPVELPAGCLQELERPPLGDCNPIQALSCINPGLSFRPPVLPVDLNSLG